MNSWVGQSALGATNTATWQSADSMVFLRARLHARDLLRPRSLKSAAMLVYFGTELQRHSVRLSIEGTCSTSVSLGVFISRVISSVPVPYLYHRLSCRGVPKTVSQIQTRRNSLTTLLGQVSEQNYWSDDVLVQV